MDRSKRPIAKGRIAALCITLVLAALAIDATRAAVRLSGRFAQWQVDRPVDIPVDLSKNGVTTAPFRQTCGTAHGESVFIEIEDLVSNKTDPLNGLSGSLEIIDQYGTIVVTADLANAMSLSTDKSSGTIMLTRFAPFSTGNYKLKLEVTNPAMLTADRPQRLYAQYMLCGMEKLPELFVLVLAVAWWILALFFGAPSVIGLIRHGWRTKN